MATSPLSSPIVEAVVSLLEALRPGSAAKTIPEADKEYLVCSYRASFSYLWQLDESLSLWLEAADRTFVLVWDETPRQAGLGPVNIRNHLTAFDYAVALSLTAVARQKNADPISSGIQWHLILLDLISDSQRDTQNIEIFRRLQGGAHPILPWIKVLRPAEISRMIANLLPAQQHAWPVRSSDMELLRRLWTAPLVSPLGEVDHHAIANLVGPQLLMGETSPFADDHLRALRRLMGVLGLYPSKAYPDPGSENLRITTEKLSEPQHASLGPVPEPSRPEFLLLTEQRPWVDLPKLASNAGLRLSLILVDDQWQTGWGEVLCRAVGVRYNGPGEDTARPLTIIGHTGSVTLKASSSAEWVLERLGRSPAEDQRFALTLTETGTGDDSLELLFLDLRLYSGRGLAEEANFFARLLEIAHICNERKSLPWPGFSADELNEIDRWLQASSKSRNDLAYFKALTILPRLLALADFSLPIVLFSSTGKREILEILGAYRNILTEFDKPRFYGYVGLDFLRTAQKNFHSAMYKSVGLLIARSQCNELRKTLSGKDSAKSLTLPPIPARRHIELYVDESQATPASPFYVGGCFAVFEGDQTIGDPREKADLFDDDLVKGGVRYFHDLGVGRVHTPAIKRKDSGMATELIHVTTSSTHKPRLLGTVRLAADPGRTVSAESDLLNPRAIDNRYRLTLHALLELFLCETIPALFDLKLPTDPDSLSLSIYVATRTAYYGKGDTGKYLADRYRFGLSGPTDYLLYTLSREEVYPIVAEIMASHGLRLNSDRLLAVTLPYCEGHVRYPQYLVCRTCRTVVNLGRGDVQDYRQLGSTVLFNVAEVVSIADDKSYGFIRPGRGDDLFVNRREWPDLRSARIGQLVKYAAIEASEGKKARVQGVKSLSAAELSSLNPKLAISPQCQCTKAGKPSAFVPDYRALHYLADQLLGAFPPHKGSYRSTFGSPAVPGEYDDALNGALTSSISASRDLDQNDIAGAVTLVRPSHLAPGQDLPSARYWICRRIAASLSRLDGISFCSIARKLSQS